MDVVPNVVLPGAGQPEKGILTKNWDETVVMMLIIIHCDVVQDIIHFMQ